MTLQAIQEQLTQSLLDGLEKAKAQSMDELGWTEQDVVKATATWLAAIGAAIAGRLNLPAPITKEEAAVVAAALEWQRVKSSPRCGYTALSFAQANLEDAVLALRVSSRSYEWRNPYE